MLNTTFNTHTKKTVRKCVLIYCNLRHAAIINKIDPMS